MARMKGKGTVLKVTISAVLTAIPGITSISVDGEESITEEVITLDGASAVDMDPTGYNKPSTITAEFYYDAAHATHAFIKTTMRTPANFPNAMTITYTDSGPVTATHSCTGIKWSEKIDGNGRVKATAVFQMSGAVS